jgi:hypothetical protein
MVKQRARHQLIPPGEEFSTTARSWRVSAWQSSCAGWDFEAGGERAASAHGTTMTSLDHMLARLVEQGAIAGAGPDVFEHEPAINPKLVRSDRGVALPHLGSATIEGLVDMGEKVIINIKTFLDGHNPPDRVHPGMF